MLRAAYSAPSTFIAELERWAKIIYMTDTTDNRLTTLLSRIGGFLAVSAPMAAGLFANAKGELPIQMQLAIPLLGAFVSVLVAWGWWTISLVRKDSKRGKIKEAHGVGRMLCACTESGEILTLHHSINADILVYACPVCARIDILRPNGEVSITVDTEFKPTLPKNAHLAWLRKSSAGR
jgi:hypothetical protein